MPPAIRGLEICSQAVEQERSFQAESHPLEAVDQADQDLASLSDLLEVEVAEGAVEEVAIHQEILQDNLKEEVVAVASSAANPPQYSKATAARRKHLSTNLAFTGWLT